MAEYTGCDDCRHSDKGLREFPCTVCIHNAIDKFEPKTNADVIRAMSDAELAEFLCGVFDEDECNGKYICGITIPDYDEDRIAEWLKSEVEE